MRPATALTGELESVAFEIDNTPPEISSAATRVDERPDYRDASTSRTITRRFSGSNVRRMDSTGGACFPVDGIADSKIRTLRGDD